MFYNNFMSNYYTNVHFIQLQLFDRNKYVVSEARELLSSKFPQQMGTIDPVGCTEIIIKRVT